MKREYLQEVIARGKRIRKLRKERIKKELEELNSIKKTSTKSKAINICFILAVFFGLIIYMIKVDGINNIIYVLENANYKWIFLGFILLIIEWLLQTIEVHIPLKNMYPNLKYLATLKSNIIGLLFNNITPFSSGGQPFQAYALSKYGLKMSDAFSALMMKFIVYEVGLFTWIAVLFITKFDFLYNIFNGHMWLIALGFLTNAFASLSILLAGLNKNLVLKIVKPIISFGAKIKIIKRFFIKDFDATIKKIEDSVSNCSNQFNEIKKQKGSLLKMYLAVILQLLAYFAIPFAIYKAFGNTGASFIEIITVQAYLLLIMSFVPTPGSGLGAEGGFAFLYKTIFINGLNMAILFWRIYTFYLPIIIGPFVFLSVNRKKINKEKEVE